MIKDERCFRISKRIYLYILTACMYLYMCAGLLSMKDKSTQKASFYKRVNKLSKAIHAKTPDIKEYNKMHLLLFIMFILGPFRCLLIMTEFSQQQRSV